MANGEMIGETARPRGRRHFSLMRLVVSQLMNEVAALKPICRT